MELLGKLASQVSCKLFVVVCEFAQTILRYPVVPARCTRLSASTFGMCLRDDSETGLWKESYSAEVVDKSLTQKVK